ncbi:MAG TPA: protein kinase, partial [Candidatus Acidoferrum sp.]|nr:protein kinase [Candidatus Acidoferrum sp.]
MKRAGAGLEIGALVADGRYEVRACTLEGPAYVDYRVHDREVEVELALWRMDPVLYAGEEDCASFEQAAAEMRNVVHPHLRRLFEAGRSEDGVPYLTMQLGSPDGIALRLGSGRPASELDLMRYANAIAEGLEAVHAAGRIHGRLVPADLVEVAGHIKVSGAGLYRGLARDPGLAVVRWGAAVRYLAPEMLAAGAGDPRADVYSMAAILCELASGVSRPDLGEATEQLATEQLSLADLLARALSQSPERRPGRPAELIERMRRLFVDERVQTVKRPVVIPPEARGPVKEPALSPLSAEESGVVEEDIEGSTVQESSPLFLHPSAAPRSPLFGPNQPTLAGDRVPRGSPPPARVGPSPS